MTPAVLPYPARATERDAWILSHRPPRNRVDPRRPFSFFIEEERAESGEIVPVLTIFLTNRECLWRCLMCDLWRNTLTETVPVGAIPEQIDWAVSQSRPRANRPVRQIKLYNSGSFFDSRAIPVEDHPAIAVRVQPFERVIVECHPSLIGPRVLRFRDQIRGKLEVAMGLETSNADVLARLNKRMTLDQFSRASEFLRQNEIALRVFVLVKPPFLDETEALHWAKRSIHFAFDCGASVVSLIPTRFGNGALEALSQVGEFSLPKLSTLEAAATHGVGLRQGRVFADVWDLEKFLECPGCFEQRRARLCEMNLLQKVVPPVKCGCCEGSGGKVQENKPARVANPRQHTRFAGAD